MKLALLSMALFLAPAAAQTKDSFPLADVITQVKKELAAVRKNTPGQTLGLVLQSVQVNFAITQTTDVNGKVAIGVPIIGADLGANGERKAEDSSSLTVELEPPSASITMSGVISPIRHYTSSSRYQTPTRGRSERRTEAGTEESLDSVEIRNHSHWRRNRDKSNS